MKNRRYPTLADWFRDIKLVFENAMVYNEPGSRVFRDAKLLMVQFYTPLVHDNKDELT